MGKGRKTPLVYINIVFFSIKYSKTLKCHKSMALKHVELIIVETYNTIQAILITLKTI